MRRVDYCPVDQGRRVRVIVTQGEDCLGTAGPWEVLTAWWTDVAPVNARLSAELGVPVMVLRLLTVDGGDGGRDSHVRYHAEALEPPARVRLGPAPADADRLAAPTPGRAVWATRDGLAAALGWAEDALREARRPTTGPAQQIKTWNLAGLFRLPTARGPVWLKTLPPFAADEAAVIGTFGGVAPAFVPRVVAADPAARRVLLDEVPGADCWAATPRTTRAAVSQIVAAQAALADASGPFLEGLADHRGPALVREVAALLDSPTVAGLTGDERDLADRLPAVLAELAACGLPDTLVHGDFHPGNWRTDGHGVVALDWSDAFRGHPAVDGLRPSEFLPADLWQHAADAWVTAWRAARPASDPARALALAGPVADLAFAARSQQYLDAVEDSEWPYHAGDLAAMAGRVLRTGTATPR
jgi:hypothetical protein